MLAPVLLLDARWVVEEEAILGPRKESLDGGKSL